MKKRTVSLTVLIALVMAAVISCKTKFNTTKAAYTATPSSARFERGKVLAFSICGGCHYDKQAKKFIGAKLHDIPSIAGKVVSANLTHSKTGVTDNYTDAEIRYLLKTGIARDGRFLNYMLRPNMADEDIAAIIVYLRSNDEALQPGQNTAGLTKLTLIGKAFMNLKASPVPYKADVLPDAGNLVANGYYLVDNLGCFHCHSKKLTSLNYRYPDQTKGYLSGGIKFKGEKGEVRASNITPDKNTGIGNYTSEQFLTIMKEGTRPGGEKLKPPMPKFTMLKNVEIDAIYAYLQTVPAKQYPVK
jgi:mono/diheme cytochrome c family protein